MEGQCDRATGASTGGQDAAAQPAPVSEPAAELSAGDPAIAEDVLPAWQAANAAEHATATPCSVLMEATPRITGTSSFRTLSGSRPKADAASPTSRGGNPPRTQGVLSEPKPRLSMDGSSSCERHGLGTPSPVTRTRSYSRPRRSLASASERGSAPSSDAPGELRGEHVELAGGGPHGELSALLDPPLAWAAPLPETVGGTEAGGGSSTATVAGVTSELAEASLQGPTGGPASSHTDASVAVEAAGSWESAVDGREMVTGSEAAVNGGVAVVGDDAAGSSPGGIENESLQFVTSEAAQGGALKQASEVRLVKEDHTAAKDAEPLTLLAQVPNMGTERAAVGVVGQPGESCSLDGFAGLGVPDEPAKLLDGGPSTLPDSTPSMMPDRGPESNVDVLAEVSPKKAMAAGRGERPPGIPAMDPGHEQLSDVPLDTLESAGFGGLELPTSLNTEQRPAPPTLKASGGRVAPVSRVAPARQDSVDSDSVQSATKPLLQGEGVTEDLADAARGRLSEALRWECGKQRQELRQQFNSHEVSVTILLRRYDEDHTGVLEAEELRALLTDYNNGRPVKDDDLRFIMMAADANRDDCISSDELLYALKVWYAFRHMPKSVGAALTRYGIGGGPLPSAEALSDLLVTLNDSLPVPAAEVEQVLAVALRLGATEQLATVEQMRKAVATWYLHLQRDETRHAQLAADAHAVAIKQLGLNMITVQEVLCGSAEYDMLADAGGSGFPSFLNLWEGAGGVDRRKLVVTLALGTLTLLLASLELSIGLSSGTGECEKNLHNILSASGMSLLLATVFNCGASAVYAIRDLPQALPQRWARLVPYALVLVNLVQLVLIPVGFSRVVTTSPDKCGATIWEMCIFAYIILPLGLVASVCCGPCCCLCCLSAMHGIDRYNTDKFLMDP